MKDCQQNNESVMRSSQKVKSIIGHAEEHRNELRV